ncbi:unnamed protein product [Effrenium voratum]|nr:unnamed protein product [Effrenium voratum]
MPLWRPRLQRRAFAAPMQPWRRLRAPHPPAPYRLLPAGVRWLLRRSLPSEQESAVTRRALDQSSRYADLSLDEATLIKNGKHVLVAYIMKPKAGYDYLATAAHFAAESSTGTNVNVCTTDDFTKSVDALVYYIDPDNEEMKIAYPNLLFDRNITDGRGMMCSFLTLAIGNNQGSLVV